MTSPSQRLVDAIGIQILGTMKDAPAHPGDEADFRLQAHQITVSAARMVCLVLAVAAALGWPFEFLAFEPWSREFLVITRWHLVFALGLALGFLALRFIPQFERHPTATYVLSALFMIGLFGFSGYTGVELGGITTPIIYGIYGFPLATIFFVLPLRSRLLLTLVVIGVPVAFVLHLHPVLLDDRGLVSILVYLGGIMLASIVIGHVVFALIRLAFLRKVALEHRTMALEQASESRNLLVEQQAGEIRSLAQQLIDLQEHERRRIARDLHDELGQLLAGLQMQIDRAVRVSMAEGLAANDLRGILDDSRRLLAGLHDSVDRIIADLRPKILDTSGLATAIEWLVKVLREKFGFQGSLELGFDEERLGESESVAVYRIVQESLNNVCKHAGARTVDVAILDDGTCCSVRIADDGLGFDPGATERGATRFGMLGIKERVRILGGTLRLRSEPGQGTELAVVFPLAALLGDTA